MNEIERSTLEETYNPEFTAVIGIDESKSDIVVNWSTVYNVLVSGTVGSGKTNFVRNVLLSLVERCHEDLQLVIYDSKGIDYQEYVNSGHLLIPMVKDKMYIGTMLNYISYEVESRLEVLEGVAKDIDSYNQNVETTKRLPRIVAVIDGYEDIAASQGLLDSLIRILTRNEGTGIHVILVTSTITKKTIEPIKYLVDSFVAFASPDSKYSKLAIGVEGAEHLKYPGGMIFKNLNNFIVGETTLAADYRERLPIKASPVYYKKDKQSSSNWDNTTPLEVKEETCSLRFKSPNGQYDYTYKFYVKDINRIVFHKKRVLSKPYLEITLSNIPLIAENLGEPIIKSVNIVSPFVQKREDELFLLDIANDIASKANIEVIIL